MSTQHDPIRQRALANILNEDLGTASSRVNMWRGGSTVAKELGLKPLPRPSVRKTHTPTNHSTPPGEPLLHWIECACGYLTVKRQVYVDARKAWIGHRDRAHARR